MFIIVRLLDVAIRLMMPTASAAGSQKQIEHAIKIKCEGLKSQSAAGSEAALFHLGRDRIVFMR